MEENKITKKLSRRDAIKLLGAATGATLLANLPPKWSKPTLVSGVLPAHAQTSLAIACGSGLSINTTNNSGTVNASASIIPASNGSPLIYAIEVVPNQGIASVTSPNPLINTLPTVGGLATLPVTVQALTYTGHICTGVVNITWAIPKSGISCIQQINYVFSEIG